MKLFSPPDIEETFESPLELETVESRKYPWVQQSATLQRVEAQFVKFFLAQIGPTKKSESKRHTIFNKIKDLIQKAYPDEGNFATLINICCVCSERAEVRQ